LTFHTKRGLKDPEFEKFTAFYLQQEKKNKAFEQTRNLKI